MATNGHVLAVPGAVVIMHASGKGGVRSMLACRVRRSGALTAWHRGIGCGGSRVVQGLEVLCYWTWGGGGRGSMSHTRLARLELLLALCRQWGGKLSSSMLTIDDLA